MRSSIDPPQVSGARAEMPANEPSVEEASAALSQLLSAPGFQVSERNKKFLNYVVTETLAARSQRIKSYTIAIDVFGRGADFDSTGDSIVRTEATRLRAALARYYGAEGASDPIRVLLPPGFYVPRFERRAPSETPAPDASPTVAAPVAAGLAIDATRATPAASRVPTSWAIAMLAIVIAVALGALAFNRWSTHGGVSVAPIVVLAMTQPIGAAANIQNLAKGLDESLVLALTRYSGFAVARASERESADVILARPRQPQRTAYLLESSIDNDLARLRFRWRLVSPGDQQVLWSDEIDEPLDANSVLNIEDRIAEGVARIMASRGGIVAQNELHAHPVHSASGYACVLEGLAYMASQSVVLHAEARDCLERTIDQEPDYVDALAVLSYIYNDESRNGYNPRGAPEEINARAMAASDRALKLAPQSSLVMLTRSTVLFQNGDYAASEAAGRKAIALNPANPENYSVLGNRLFLLGRYDEGAALVRQSILMDPSPPAVSHTMTMLNSYRLGDYEAAAREAEALDIDPDNYPLFFTIAAIYGELGDKAKAAPYVANLLRLRPNFAVAFRDDLRHRHAQPDLIDHLADGLRKAGLSVQ